MVCGPRRVAVLLLALAPLAACKGGSLGGQRRDGGGPRENDATLVRSEVPGMLACGAAARSPVVFRNSGSTTWTSAEGYRLVAVDGRGALASGTEVELPAGTSVGPGREHTFELPLVAPATAGLYTTRWQMEREGVARFGEAVEAEVLVDCIFTPPPLVLSEVLWLHADVSTWPEVSPLDVTFRSGNTEICFTHGASWPAASVEGASVFASPWIFIHWSGRWHGGTWEWLAPADTCKFTASVSGDGIRVAPFDAESGWVPRSGQIYYVMLSGLARTDDRNVMERTAAVPVTWP
jgi:hypothetical protein